MSSVIVDTRVGKLSGVCSDHGCTFKGVPYAAPPVGARRFLPPVAHPPWSGVREATGYGPRAWQDDQSFPLAPPIRALMTPAAAQPMSEDCLVLNLWTPQTGSGKRPVMVWLHGGAFITGSGADPWTDAGALSRAGDVVVVTVNHRLGAFGYLHLEDIAGDACAGSSVAGMLDVVAALEWIRDNIAGFGGDAGNVTLFGQSGGGAKVSILMAMPAAHGLFHRAIIQSGPALQMASRDDGARTAASFLTELGLAHGGLAQLQALPAELVLKAQASVLKKIPLTSFAERRRHGFNPVAGQPHFPSGPFEPDAPLLSAGIPLLIGTTQDEMTIFFGMEDWLRTLDEAGLIERLQPFVGARAAGVVSVYRDARPGASSSDLFLAIVGDLGIRIPSLTMADRKLAQGGAAVYVYLFRRETSVLSGCLKSTHILEVPYVFGTLERAPFAERTHADHRLSRQMTQAWSRFAWSGVPQADALPEWPQHCIAQRPTMVFDLDSRIERDPFGQERSAWGS